MSDWARNESLNVIAIPILHAQCFITRGRPNNETEAAYSIWNQNAQIMCKYGTSHVRVFLQCNYIFQR